VKVRQIEVKEDITREALKTALVHLNAIDLHEKEEEKSIGEVIDTLEDTRSLMFRGSRAIQAKNSGHKVLELVQAFIKVGNTEVKHRVDLAIFDLVEMLRVWINLQDELGQEGKKTALKHYQNILQLHASFWADADTLHVAVVVPIMRTEATAFAAYEIRIPPVLAGKRMAYLQLDEEVLLVHRATGTIAHTGDMDDCIEMEATRYCNVLCTSSRTRWSRLAKGLYGGWNGRRRGRGARSGWSGRERQCKHLRRMNSGWCCQRKRNVRSPPTRNLPRQDKWRVSTG
jgi:hypothetical protein